MLPFVDLAILIFMARLMSVALLNLIYVTYLLATLILFIPLTLLQHTLPLTMSVLIIILKYLLILLAIHLMVKALFPLVVLFYLMVTLRIFRITGKYVMAPTIHPIYPINLFLVLRPLLLTMLEKIVTLVRNLIIFLVIPRAELR